MSKIFGTRTVPVRQTREMSLRSKSTIIRFSARSLRLSRRLMASDMSSCGRPDRRRVPLIGLVSTRPREDIRKRSGEADSTCTKGRLR